MMSVLQNAFANSSSSLIQSKITGNLIFVLLPPLSPLDFFAAYVLGAMVRGLVVGLGVFAVTLFFAPSLLAMPHPFWALAFALARQRDPRHARAASAGIWADKFDQLAAFQNFIIMPLTFLSGVFYSIHSLPPFWQALSHVNPFFYMIDGFRYGFFGLSDVPPALSLAIVAACALALSRADARCCCARLEAAPLSDATATTLRSMSHSAEVRPWSRRNPSGHPSQTRFAASTSRCAATASTWRR